MNIQAKSTVLVVLIGSLLVSLYATGWAFWQIYWIGGWRDQVYGLIGRSATVRAMDDFKQGHLRIYVFGGDNELHRYTGTNEGPFEIWIPPFSSEFASPERYATEQFIIFYNRKMRYMHTRPDRFPRPPAD
jgi:hypothetical protein